MSVDQMLVFLLKNKKRGALGEKIAKEDYIFNGFKIIQTGIGSDFVAYKKINGKIYEEYVEVKTGKARQSIVQKRKMKEIRRRGMHYSIYRITDKFLTNYIENQAETDRFSNSIQSRLKIVTSDKRIEKLYSKEGEA